MTLRMNTSFLHKKMINVKSFFLSQEMLYILQKIHNQYIAYIIIWLMNGNISVKNQEIHIF
jgi:hypothetical protein